MHIESEIVIFLQTICHTTKMIPSTATMRQVSRATSTENFLDHKARRRSRISCTFCGVSSWGTCPTPSREINRRGHMCPLFSVPCLRPSPSSCPWHCRISSSGYGLRSANRDCNVLTSLSLLAWGTMASFVPCNTTTSHTPLLHNMRTCGKRKEGGGD